MGKINDQWLPKLEGCVPTRGYGNKLSMYTLALEAWRRGIKIKFYTIDNPENKLLIRYSLSLNGREHHFESSRGDKITDEAYKICDNKQLTKDYLRKAGVPVPDGKRFKSDINDGEIINFAQEINYPVVVKPISENAGKGVFANIESEERLKEVLKHVRGDLQYRDIIVEQFIPGEEFRIYMVGNKVLSAVKRVPANIVGDGIHSIKELIERKNINKKKNPLLYKNLLEIDLEVQNSIEKLGYSLDSVLKNGEQVFLRNKSNVSRGGDPIDVTDQLTEEMKDIAVRASSAIPGLAQCGLDMIVDVNKNKGVIIEANSKPMIGLHLFPLEGEPYDVLKPTIDYYFPETADTQQTNLYFDFDSVLEPLKSYATNEIILTPPPLGELITKKYIIKRNAKDQGFKSLVRRQALQRGLHGYIKKIEGSSENLEIVVAAINEEEIISFTHAIDQEKEKFGISSIEINDYIKPVRVGFCIVKEANSVNVKDLKKEKSEKEKALAKLEKQSKQLELINEKFDATVNKLDEKITELENEKFRVKAKSKRINNLKKEKERLSQEIIQLNNKNRSLEAKNKRLLQSKTWRYTRGLRKLYSLIKR
ncbi:ATP-grasp domain-containing protein [Evansella halocellulosilytica]|uniref:ATP-grasp domain-containing protein n=1 Tax=Evansella halocellulosilytica TaxID=2011013 RepID=UPI000BB8570D|nr:ATP-grasp domain-containing protein [Evansella halocellulosilytica]